MALDYILASHGRTCAVLGKECCTYIPDNEENITHFVVYILIDIHLWYWDIFWMRGKLGLMRINCAFNLLRKSTPIAPVIVELNNLQGQTTTLLVSQDGVDKTPPAGTV